MEKLTKIEELKASKELLLPQLEEVKKKHQRAKNLADGILNSLKELEEFHEQAKKQAEQETLKEIKEKDLDYIPLHYYYNKEKNEEAIDKLGDSYKVFNRNYVGCWDDKEKKIKEEISKINSETKRLTRIDLRKQIKKEGRELLSCNRLLYSKNTTLGCMFDENDHYKWCENCETNYLTPLELLTKKVKRKSTYLKGIFERLQNDWCVFSEERIKSYEKEVQEICNFFSDSGLVYIDSIYKNIPLFIESGELKESDVGLLTNFINDIQSQVERGDFWISIKNQPRTKQFELIREKFSV